jgi:hypothetical protein
MILRNISVDHRSRKCLLPFIPAILHFASSDKCENGLFPNLLPFLANFADEKSWMTDEASIISIIDKIEGSEEMSNDMAIQDGLSLFLQYLNL